MGSGGQKDLSISPMRMESGTVQRKRHNHQRTKNERGESGHLSHKTKGEIYHR